MPSESGSEREYTILGHHQFCPRILLIRRSYIFLGISKIQLILPEMDYHKCPKFQDFRKI